MTRQLVFHIVIVIMFFASCNNRSISKKVNLLDTVSFEKLSKISCEYLKKQQAYCQEKYKIGKYERWDYDQSTGKLIFSDKGVQKGIIDYEEVGSVSLTSNTWLWAWDNSSIEESVKLQIATVRSFGIKRGFTRLYNAEWSADIVDGWDMAAISAYILKAKGVYRVPSNDNKLFSFMLFKKITVVDSLPKKKSQL
ncbi:DUF6882 domain-containing protein [Pedobacter zeae]|uniref:Lipoprotein n=2 Tax=Pedobacter zeae TaxID=1737356 RepID=A0A7W6P7A9_9SPHI|nr:DUF6882 domain-containing protein [Pedobacter zeae]MBB4109718.1 hypothetical protein [Pedobacter zeae]